MKRLLSCFLLILLIFASCAGDPLAIPENAEVQELVQRAQEASDTGKFDLAISYYQAIRDRFGMDPAALTAADYEIAFIYYKQGKKAESQALFETILGRYADAAPGVLPERYRILAEKILAKIKTERKASPAKP